MAYPSFAAVAPNPVLLVVGDGVVVDLLAELAELVVGVVGVADFAEGPVLVGLNFGLYTLVDFRAITVGVETLLIAIGLAGGLFPSQLLALEFVQLPLYIEGIVRDQLRGVVLLGVAVLPSRPLGLLVQLGGPLARLALLAEI